MEYSSTVLMVGAAVLVLLALGLTALIARRRGRTHQLAERYGPEYDRTVQQLGGRVKAEKDMIGRQDRVEATPSVPSPTPSAAASLSCGARCWPGSWTARWPPYRKPTSS